jgi:hypothetical protein
MHADGGQRIKCLKKMGLNNLNVFLRELWHSARAQNT